MTETDSAVAKLDEIEIQALATAEDTILGRVLLRLSGEEIERRTQKYRAKPKIGTVEVRDDLRHKLGEIEGLAFIPGVVSSARGKLGR